MRIRRIGFTALKGAAHLAREAADLTIAGPEGDRVFCLVERSTARVLRTVQHPAMLATVARWHAGVLTVDLPGGRAEGVPVPTGERLVVDYWSRAVQADVLAGPWAAAYSDHLGRDVVLVRPDRAGAVVYGAPVSLVTTSSLAVLADRLGRTPEAARFRATFVVETGYGAGHVEGHVEDGWAGQELALGAARVRVRGPIPRCAVVDLDPADGSARNPVLRTLAGYRRHDGEVHFAVDAEVTSPGEVEVGDAVTRC